VEVAEVGHHTPATDKLQVGDIITAFNGRTIADSEEIRDAVADTDPGATVKITVFRNGQYQDVDVTIGSQPDDLEAAMRDGAAPEDQNSSAPRLEQASPTFGLTGLRTLTPAFIDQLNKEAGQPYLDQGTSGCIITGIGPGSIADKAHLAVGDVITHVGREAINTSRQAKDALDKADATQGVRIRVLTPEGPHFFFLANEDDKSTNN